MKTLQQHIREANPKELADAYLHLLPFDCLAYQDSDLSVREILSRRKENVCLFIKELRESPSAEPNPDSIFLSFKTYEDGRSKLSVGLCYAKEVLLMKAPEFYAIDFIRMEEALGYLVADNRYTQANIVDTLAEILVELTFFGLHQEELEKAESSLKKALDELEAAPEEGRGVTIDKLFPEVERPSEEESALISRIIEAAYDYETYFKTREIGELRESLKRGY